MTAAARDAPRLTGLDALRGWAIVWMVVFHSCFDLSWLGFAHFDLLGSPWWVAQRLAIVSLFLFCSGFGQSEGAGRSARRWWLRWLQIAACGLVVSVGSWMAFPTSFIYFGILQSVAAMLLLHRLLLGRFGVWLLCLVPVALAAPWMVASPLLDPPWWNWTGLIAHKPITEDYVPLLPWLGVFCLGAGLAATRLRARLVAMLAQLPRPTLLLWLGRHPLRVYMLHQPLLLALLWPLAQWTRHT